jgi:hypothetical protein
MSRLTIELGRVFDTRNGLKGKVNLAAHQIANRS